MYDKEKIFNQCLEVIKEEKLTFFNDLSIFIEPTMATLYEWDFDKSDTLKEELKKNKLAAKRKMRNKWEDSDNATLQIAAYKLMADRDEMDALVMNKVEQSGALTINWNEERTYETK